MCQEPAASDTSPKTWIAAPLHTISSAAIGDAGRATAAKTRHATPSASPPRRMPMVAVVMSLTCFAARICSAMTPSVLITKRTATAQSGAAVSRTRNRGSRTVRVGM
jgi:hypothetical protein